MRIVAGRLRGRKLSVPRGGRTRPTTDRVRESMFNLVEARVDLQDARVLDLFAGTGALGLEAISRGAGNVLFVESDARVLQSARKNAADLDVTGLCTFVPMSATVFLRRPVSTKFDLILVDPPYDLEKLTDLPDLAAKHVAKGGIIVLEHDKRIHFDEHVALLTSRKYGRTIVSVFKGTAFNSTAFNSTAESDDQVI